MPSLQEVPTGLSDNRRLACVFTYESQICHYEQVTRTFNRSGCRRFFFQHISRGRALRLVRARAPPAGRAVFTARIPPCSDSLRACLAFVSTVAHRTICPTGY